MFDPSLKALAESFIYGLICGKCGRSELRNQHRLK